MSVRKFPDLGQSVAFDALRDVSSETDFELDLPGFQGAAGLYGESARGG